MSIQAMGKDYVVRRFHERLKDLSQRETRIRKDIDTNPRLNPSVEAQLYDKLFVIMDEKFRLNETLSNMEDHSNGK